MNEIALLFLEQVCEAIYFSLFLIFGKNLKEKRLLFIGIMIFEYIGLKCFIKYNVWFQLIYTFMVYVNLKVLYKEKAQITDIFLFATSSIILIFISALFLPILFKKPQLYILLLIINRILIFAFVILLRRQIRNKYINVQKYWNKREQPVKIRSLTLRNISVIIFNLMFYIINIGMLICLALIEKR